MRLGHASDGDRPQPSMVAYRSPDDVLRDRNLTVIEKREILAAWSSDRYAVPSRPWLRDVPGLPEFIPLAEILSALRKLDADDPPPRGGAAARSFNYHIKNATSAKAGVATPKISSLELKTALIAAHQRNIDRYCRLLAGNLTELERTYVHKRIAEECKELECICGGRDHAGPAGPPGKTFGRRR